MFYGAEVLNQHIQKGNEIKQSRHDQYLGDNRIFLLCRQTLTIWEKMIMIPGMIR